MSIKLLWYYLLKLKTVHLSIKFDNYIITFFQYHAPLYCIVDIKQYLKLFNVFSMSQYKTIKMIKNGEKKFDAILSLFESFCAIMTSYSFIVSHCFLLFYIAFSILFLSSLHKKLINFRSKWYKPFLDFRRPLPTSTYLLFKFDCFDECKGWDFVCYLKMVTLLGIMNPLHPV